MDHNPGAGPHRRRFDSPPRGEGQDVSGREPLLATTLVYAVRRSRISSKWAYLLKVTLMGYVLYLLGPLAMLVFFMVLGTGAEMASLYTVFLAIPVVAVMPVVVAARASRAG